MKKLFQIMILFCDIVSYGYSQTTSTIKGKVVDKKTGEELVGANIHIVGTKNGSKTNLSGRYVICNIVEGEYKLQISYIGYKEESIEITVKSDETKELDFFLKATDITANEIQVLGYENIQRKEDVRTSIITLKASQMKTMPGAAEDLFRALQSMPGVSTTNDMSSQLTIRGASSAQNLTIIDNMEFFSPYKLYGAYSIFNPDMVSNVNLITGGFPAKYGDRLSSVVDVTNRSGTISSDLTGVINANSTYANMVAEGVIPISKSSSWIFSFRRSYLELIAFPLVKAIDPTYKISVNDLPNFTDFQTKLNFNISNEHTVQFSGIFNFDFLNYKLPTYQNNIKIDSTFSQNKTFNLALGASWFYYPTPDIENHLYLNAYLFWTEINYYKENVDINFPRTVQYESLRSITNGMIGKFSLKDEFKYKGFERHDIESGIGADILLNNVNAFLSLNDLKRNHALYQQGQGLDPTAIEGSNVFSLLYWRASVYVQDRIEVLSDKLYIQPSVRFDYYDINKKAYVSPRMNASCSLDDYTTLRAACGLYYQSPGFEKLANGSSYIDFTSIDPNSMKNVTAESSIHYILGVERMIDKSWSVKAEGYFKQYFDLISAKKNSFQSYEPSYLGGDPFSKSSWKVLPDKVTRYYLTNQLENSEYGYSYGAEILVMKKSKPNVITNWYEKLDGWMSYSFGISKRIENGVPYTSPFEQQHSFNCVISYQVTEWLVVGLQWKIATGQAYTNLVAKPKINDDGIIETTKDGSVLYRVTYDGNKYTERLPLYHRLDLRVAGLVRFWDIDWIFYIDVTNTYNSNNIYKYNYQSVNPTGSIASPIEVVYEPVRMLPILPGFGITAKL